MYIIKCDDFTLYNPLDSELAIASPTLNLEVNKAGSLSFSIYPTHPYYNNIKKMESVITVFQDSKIIFKGRAFSDTANFYKVKKVEVEGLLTYFNDTIVRPYEFKGNVTEYLDFIIDQHNEQASERQKFIRGVVTVTDPNDYIVRASSNNPKTWVEIEDKLIKLLGGYICIRYEEDGNYIDYIKDYTDVAIQDIKFAVNLLDLDNTVKGDTLATCIIPYGAKLSDIEEQQESYSDDDYGENNELEDKELRVDITTVNNGADYIFDSEAVAKYGKIYEVVIWDDVTKPENLLQKAKIYLAEKIKLNSTLTIKAVDLHLTDEEIGAFKIGEYIKVYSSVHNIDEKMLLTSYSLDITNPTSFTFTMNKVSTSFLDTQLEVERKTTDNVNRIDEVNKRVDNTNKDVQRNFQETLQYINSCIENSQSYVRTILQEYRKTSDMEDITELISTSFQQTANEIQFVFNKLTQSISDNINDVYNDFNEMSKYIRFVDGDILLGEDGNDLITRISNGHIAFEYNGVEVAYFEDDEQFVESVRILSHLTIGKFAFVPRANGNLSFKYLGTEEE